MVTTTTAPVGVINTYAGPDTLKLRAGITGSTQESLLWLALYGASRAVDRFCNRHFFVLNQTRRFDVEHPDKLPVPDLATITTSTLAALAMRSCAAPFPMKPLACSTRDHHAN